MTLTGKLLFGLTGLLILALATGQHDLELDYSNEYDSVRPQLVYPDEPRLDRKISSAAREFGEGIKSAWQSMVDSFRNYFDELKSVFADGFNSNATEYYDFDQ